MSANPVIKKMIQVGVVPVVRTDREEEAFDAVNALIKGGIPIAEITMTTPNAHQIIAKLIQKFGELLTVGAGTVTDISMCSGAIAAGSHFIVTPTLHMDIIQICVKKKVCIIGGALTPTEILTTWKAGADAVKVFPVSAMGGPRYLQMIHEPLPQIPLVATGGVSLETLPEYLKAGALFVAAGGDLIFRDALKNGKVEQIAARTRQYIEAIQAARNKK
jgi:2-dehydro-3-deoxyphosphogluconate aldolase/(4S)-4-hydroxy-2-oxoglutarate aldolase